MRIGIDIDGVLTNIEQFSVDYASKYCFENNIEYDITCSDYTIQKTFNITKEQENNFWTDYIDFYSKNEKARPFSSQVIQKLKDDGHEIYIITARWLTNRDDQLGINMKNTVNNWLYENNIYYDNLIFSKGDNESKVSEIKDNSIDIMIEDNPKNINELSNIVKVICYNTSYNTDCLNDNIIRCYSWYDIYNKIKKMKY